MTDFPESEARKETKQYCKDNRFNENDTDHAFYTGYREGWEKAHGEIETWKKISQATQEENKKWIISYGKLADALKFAVEALEDVRNGMIKIKDATTTGYRQIIDQALAKIRGEHE